MDPAAICLQYNHFLLLSRVVYEGIVSKRTAPALMILFLYHPFFKSADIRTAFNKGFQRVFKFPDHGILACVRITAGQHIADPGLRRILKGIISEITVAADGVNDGHGRYSPAARCMQIVLQHGTGIDRKQVRAFRTPMPVVPFLRIRSPFDVHFIFRTQLLTGHFVVIRAVL